MTDYTGFEIRTDTISNTLDSDFIQSFNEIFNGEYMMNILSVAKEYIIKRLDEFEVNPDETINNIPIKTVIHKLIDTLEIRISDSDDQITYTIGWFDTESIELIKLFEYGTQTEDSPSIAHPIIQNIMISESEDSLIHTIAPLVDNIINILLNMIAK